MSRGNIKRLKRFELIKSFHDSFNLENELFCSRELYNWFLIFSDKKGKNILPHCFFQIFSGLVKNEKKFIVLKGGASHDNKFYGIKGKCPEFVTKDTIESYKIKNRERVRWRY